MILFTKTNNQFKRSGVRSAVAVITAALILVCFSADFIGSTNTVFAAADYRTEVHMGETVKVGLKYGNNAVSHFELTCDGGFCVAEKTSVSGESYYSVIQTLANTALSVDSSGGGVTVSDKASGAVLIDSLKQESIILPFFYSEGYVLSIDGTMYRGGVSYTLNSSGSMNIINVVNINQYVYGVLPSEIGIGSPLETQKAQAVAARSYANTAALKGGNHSSYGFDVCSGTHCQVYRGYNSENTITNLATDETEGLCLYFNGKPVTGYYAKNSGGYTQDVADVWGGDADYLKAVPDPYCPEYKFEVSYTFAELEDMLEKAGKGVGTLTKVEITETADNGNVKELTFTGSSGTVSYRNSNVRALFSASKVKSNMFRFNGRTEYVELDSSNKIIQKEEPKESGRFAGVLKLQNLMMLSESRSMLSAGKNIVYMIGADGRLSKTSKDDADYIYVLDGNGNLYQASGKADENEETGGNDGTNNDYTLITTVVGDTVCTDGVLNIYGLGYGHGLGMQQDGAITMGKLGWSYEEILKYYYTGIEIK